MSVQPYHEFYQEKHTRVPLWKEWLVRLLGTHRGFCSGCEIVEFRGSLYALRSKGT